MQVKFSQIGVPLPSLLLSHLFGPTFGNKGSSDAGCCNQGLELIPEEDSHLIKIKTRFYKQMVAERLNHQGRNSSFPAYSSWRCVDAPKNPQVSADIDDHKLATFSFFSHLRCGEQLACYHITNEIQL